jgi:small subunit ribosomal protein S4e
MHLKRNQAPKNWPIPRKGTKFLVRNRKKGIPVLILIRDVMKKAKNRNEVKEIIHDKKVKANGKIIRDEKFTLSLFDILELGDKKFKVVLKNKKFGLEETKEQEKISKIIGKKILAGNKVQINLNDGRNFISNEKFRIGDSIILSDEKIKKLELKEGARIIIINGKHKGEEGQIEKIEGINASISLKDGKTNLKLNDIMAIR